MGKPNRIPALFTAIRNAFSNLPNWLSTKNFNTIKSSLSNLESIRTRLIMVFLAIALIPLLIVGSVALAMSQQALRQEASDRLIITRNTKSVHLQNHLSQLEKNVNQVMSLETISEYASSLILAWNDTEPEEIRNLGFIGHPELDNVDNQIRGNYPYRNNHINLHSLVSDIIDGYGFKDVLLVGHDGYIVYSYAKHDDFATNLINGPYKESPLTNFIRDIYENPESGRVYVNDYVYYEPAGDQRVIFLAKGVEYAGITIGTLVFIQSIDELNKVMQDSSGLGDHGEAYLINEDGVMITPNRDGGVDLNVETKSVQQARSQKSDVILTQNYNNVDVLSAYQLTEFKDKSWVVVAEVRQDEAFAAVTGLSRWVIGLIIASVLIVIMLGFFVAQRIAAPIITLSQVAHSVAEGDIDQQVAISGKDEIGQLGEAFAKMIEYLKSMAQTSRQLAGADLTGSVNPLSEKDELGIAFKDMITNLRELVADLSSQSAGVKNAASQLTQSANQTGDATHQVTNIIQQITASIVEQTTSLANASDLVHRLEQAVEGVAIGTQEQADSANKTVDITAQINRAIQNIAADAQEGAVAATQGMEAAQQGGKIIEQTVSAMQTIKSSVGFSAAKIKEMGQRSDQIGLIIETISDIADQTNLLALNAAIEAARAGEHGKGFAVVADEVRKLAEKARTSTKEISKLIKGIQQSVNESVDAMSSGVMAVEVGVKEVDSAGNALTGIIGSSQAINQKMEHIAATSEEMISSASDLVRAMETVSTIIEQNLAAAEKMASGAETVTRTIENIAALAEENSANTEEVNATTEEVNAQVNHVAESAEQLTTIAEKLQALTNQFTL